MLSLQLSIEFTNPNAASLMKIKKELLNEAYSIPDKDIDHLVGIQCRLNKIAEKNNKTPVFIINKLKELQSSCHSCSCSHGYRIFNINISEDEKTAIATLDYSCCHGKFSRKISWSL